MLYHTTYCICITLLPLRSIPKTREQSLPGSVAAGYFPGKALYRNIFQKRESSYGYQQLHPISCPTVLLPVWPVHGVDFENGDRAPPRILKQIDYPGPRSNSALLFQRSNATIWLAQDATGVEVIESSVPRSHWFSWNWKSGSWLRPFQSILSPWLRHLRPEA